MDQLKDCRDGSDEDPKLHPGWNCTDDGFQCPDDLHCIDVTRVCDGDLIFSSEYDRCSDGSDEANCEEWECHPGFWKCADDRQCVTVGRVCDGRSSLHIPWIGYDNSYGNEFYCWLVGKIVRNSMIILWQLHWGL